MQLLVQQLQLVTTAQARRRYTILRAQAEAVLQMCALCAWMLRFGLHRFASRVDTWQCVRTAV